MSALALRCIAPSAVTSDTEDNLSVLISSCLGVRHTFLQHLAGSEGGEDELTEEERVAQVEEEHLAESMERLIMEAYTMLQKGDMQQAESLLLEGEMEKLSATLHWPQSLVVLDACMLTSCCARITGKKLSPSSGKQDVKVFFVTLCLYTWHAYELLQSNKKQQAESLPWNMRCKVLLGSVLSKKYCASESLHAI